MALVRCILGKFLGVVCHCLSPRLDFPTFAVRCLHVRNDARDPSNERWNYGWERFPSNFCLYDVSIHAIRDLLHAANLRHGTDGFTSSPKEGVLRIFFALKNPTISACFETANLGTKDYLYAYIYIYLPHFSYMFRCATHHLQERLKTTCCFTRMLSMVTWVIEYTMHTKFWAKIRVALPEDGA